MATAWWCWLGDSDQVDGAVGAAASVRAVGGWVAQLPTGRADQFPGGVAGGAGIGKGCWWALARSVGITHTSPPTSPLPLPPAGGCSPHLVPGWSSHNGADQLLVGAGEPPGMGRPAARELWVVVGVVV
jgi:hypothetical protein